MGRKLLLVGDRAGNAAPGETVEHEGGEARFVQLLRPHAIVETYTVGAVHNHDHRQFVRSRLRNAQLARDRSGLAVLLAKEEIRGGEGHRRQRMNLGAVDALCR